MLKVLVSGSRQKPFIELLTTSLYVDILTARHETNANGCEHQS